jgi:hypothetical protein
MLPLRLAGREDPLDGWLVHLAHLLLGTNAAGALDATARTALKLGDGMEEIWRRPG